MPWLGGSESNLSAGSQLADEIWARSSQRVASHLVYAEARAALAAAHRGALRGHDAVHLATALATDAPDRDLASAALKLGITIIPSCRTQHLGGPRMLRPIIRLM